MRGSANPLLCLLQTGLGQSLAGPRVAVLSHLRVSVSSGTLGVEGWLVLKGGG